MAIDWKRVREAHNLAESGPPEWPTGVRPITLTGLTLLGIGPDNRLHWDGQPIELARKVSLTWWQTTLAAMTAFGAILSAIAAILPYMGIKV